MGADASAASLKVFKADVTAIAQLTPSANPCLLSNFEAGSYTSLNLGSGTYNSQEAVNFCSTANGVGVAAQIVLTTATGDLIHAFADVTGAFQANGSIALKGTLRFVSGTGAYAGIKGLGTITGTAGAPGPTGSGPVSATLQGLYTLP